MAILVTILYVLAGSLLGIRWYIKLAAHTKTHTANRDKMGCWCSDIWGDFFLLGTYSAPLLWPLIASAIGISRLLKIVRSIRLSDDPNITKVITTADASVALLHKTLRHLIKAVENHVAVCPYKEESMAPMVNFSKEVLNSKNDACAVVFLGNMEKSLLTTKQDLNQFILFAEAICRELDEHGKTCTLKFNPSVDDFRSYIKHKTIGEQYGRKV